MKKKLKNHLKTLVLLLGISLLLWNCDKEEIEYSNNDEASIRHISYKDFKSKDNFSLLIDKVEHKYFDRLKEVEKNKFLGKTIYSSDNTFYIQTDLIYETIKDSITNYTFKIERPQIDSLKIENLIVSLNNNTNQIKLYLLEMNENNIQSDIKFYPLDINTIDNDALFSNKTATILGVSVYVPDCTQVSYSICGRGGNADGHAATGGECVGSPTILDFSNCGTGYDDDASSYSSGTGSPIPTDDSSTSGGGTTGSSSDTSNDDEFIEGAVGIIRYDSTAASTLKNNLLLSSAQIGWIGDSENYNEVRDIYNFLEANKIGEDYTSEAKSFAEEAIKLEFILDNAFSITQTNKHPEELNNCCPGDCCPNPDIYSNDQIIYEYGIKPIQASIDATFNIIVSSTELVSSDEWVGSRVRRIMTEIGVDVPTDVDNKYLAEVYQIRKKPIHYKMNRFFY